ncbi:MAG: type II toxin-antitoxin system RelE/ParE family toxin [Thermosynechococcaceae cyanobacterium]
MASYRLVFKESVTKDLRQIPKKDVERILKRIDALTENPRPPGCEKLSGQERYRVRQGAYRILYLIADQEVCITVIKVGSRRDVYDRP